MPHQQQNQQPSFDKALFDKILPDTSIIVTGTFSAMLTKGNITAKEILFHNAVLSEIEHRANEGNSIGIIGLEELEQIKKYSEKNHITITLVGQRPPHSWVSGTKHEDIDAIIRQTAYDEGAVLLTTDEIQAKLAKIMGTPVHLIPKLIEHLPLQLEKFFDETTMSVHLRENVKPMAKRGKPGEWTFDAVREELLTANEVKEISTDIIEQTRMRADGFIEIEREGSTIIQLGNYRIVITRPPFSDGWEITAVRPVKKLALEDYEMSDKLKRRILQQAEGVLIAGAPGQGKTTFTQALAEHYALQNKIVKTVEAPRDMILSETITQLAISHGSSEEVHDILLLSRPDYTLFDEMRNTKDFALYTDLRLAGVGMIGVVHATSPTDAIQRFIGRVELGVIPQVVDTVLFIKNGAIGRVLAIKMEVKVPAGMTEEDLARPIVVVSDFETGKAIAEIYSYGEETVVVPVKDEQSNSGIKSLAKKYVERFLTRYTDLASVEINSENKITIYIPENEIPRMIGREGKNVKALEEELGVSVNIEPITSLPDNEQKQTITYRTAQSKGYIEFMLNGNVTGNIDLQLNGKYLATFAIGKKGIVSIKKNNPLGNVIADAIQRGEQFTFTKKS